jgi:LGFP repeat
MSAIDDKYTQLGGPSGFLGQPTIAETVCPDRVGHYRHFQGGSIYWTAQTAAHEVHGLIRDKWSLLGWERSFLGYPLTDESPAARNGRFNHFQRGSIYWTPQTGAHEVHGAIRDKYSAMGWERSPLGYPVSDEQATPGPSRFSRFQGGSIYWTPETGPQEVYGSQNYAISLDMFHIDNTRAWNDDTDHVGFALKVGAQMQGETLIRHTGDVDNGDHLLGLRFLLQVINPATPIVFNFQIVNSGSQNTEVIRKALDSGAKALAAKAITGDWTAAAGAVAAYIGGIFVANCDGPVAVDQVVATGKQLESWTTANGIYSETRKYPGLDSSVGCGSNSRYTVTWSVVRL